MFLVISIGSMFLVPVCWFVSSLLGLFISYLRLSILLSLWEYPEITELI
jgi:phosphate/sulfate permease